jgi:molybdopterin synthase catalytic subunit
MQSLARSSTAIDNVRGGSGAALKQRSLSKPGDHSRTRHVRSADVGDWIDEVKPRPGSAAIGMILSRQGIARETAGSGEPVSGMKLNVDRQRLAAIPAKAGSWPGVFALRAWVNEGSLAVGGDTMKVPVSEDLRDNVFSSLQRLVSAIKNDVVTEWESH